MNDSQRTEIESICRQLMMRYAAATDLHDLDRLITIFAPDVLWVRPGMEPMRSHAEIRIFMKNLWDVRSAKNPHYLDVHLLTTCSIEVESAERATGATWCIMYSAPDHNGVGPAPMTPMPELVVLYRDIFVKLPEGWRIARHEAQHLFRSPVYTPPPIPASLRTPGTD